MFLFHPIQFLKFLVKSQPQRSYKKGSYIKKKRYWSDVCRLRGPKRSKEEPVRRLDRVKFVTYNVARCSDAIRASF